jgi:murein DD-endopeptidase MepM/ murein hydrolase activator NlpD
MLSKPALIRLLAAVMAGLVVTIPPVCAKNIYKYQDENGIWHFTDRAPDEPDVEFETVYMEREPEDRVRLRQEGAKHSPMYFVFNDYWGPVEVELSLSEAVNVLSEPALPARFVVPGQTEELLVGLAPQDPQQSFRFRLQLSAVPGPPGNELAQEIVLRTPFAQGKAYRVSQGFNGEKTHLGEDSKYAIDIAMPEGSPVHAVRDGVVMDVEEDFNAGGTDLEKYADKANHVRVLHEDGTMALYAHLQLASVIVRPGARVRAGQLLARSGNTGFSSGPHLHFAIQQNVGMKLVSLPFEFRQANGSSAPPREGRFIGAVPGTD